MQFQVPQFIDIEDKLFGPFSFKQFMYMLGGGGLAFVLYKFLPIFIAVPVILPVLGLAGALTFYKVNNRPFILILEAWFHYVLTKKLYIWKKAMQGAKKNTAVVETPSIPQYIPKLSSSKLHDLSWSLNVLDASKKSNQE